MVPKVDGNGGPLKSAYDVEMQRKFPFSQKGKMRQSKTIFSWRLDNTFTNKWLTKMKERNRWCIWNSSFPVRHFIYSLGSTIGNGFVLKKELQRDILDAHLVKHFCGTPCDAGSFLWHAKWFLISLSATPGGRRTRAAGMAIRRVTYLTALTLPIGQYCKS